MGHLNRANNRFRIGWSMKGTKKLGFKGAQAVFRAAWKKKHVDIIYGATNANGRWWM